MTSKRKNLPAKNISKAPKIKTDLIEDLRQLLKKLVNLLRQRLMPILQSFTGT